jgi:Leucine-rich repeat (LRR) protein
MESQMNPHERLVVAIATSKQSVLDARDALRHINEPHWQHNFGALLDQIDAVRRMHSPAPQPSIANDYANIAGLLRQIRFSEEDQDRERFRALRGARGSLLEDARVILDCAAQMHVRPTLPIEQLPDTAMLETAGREGQLIALQQRITNVETMLTERLLPEAATDKQREQAMIVNYFVRDMRRYTTSIRLSISIGDGIDLAVIERAASSMGRATIAMIDTVRAHSSKATQSLRDSVVAIGKPVKRLIGGVRILVQMVRRSDSRSTSAIPNDYIDQAKAMILAGRAPPLHWVPQIESLNFGHTDLVDITPLAQLNALTRLDLRGTQISDIAPLVELNALKTLYLMNTEISDITPLGKLTALQYLNLSNTQVSDITPLTEMSALQTLYLSHTRVIDVTPLGELTALESLYLEYTRVRNIGPLSKISHLTVYVESDARLGSLRKKLLDHSRVQVRCLFN